MSKIQARIVADSVNDFGNRLTTMVVTFPRFILAELNTHRLFSRNSASSRAIPFKKMVESVKTNPFVPIAWQKDHSGMQGTQYFSELDEKTTRLSTLDSPMTIVDTCNKAWLLARDRAVEIAELLNNDLGVTKQLVNRLLEPFMWHTVLITSSEWENFFELRCPQYQTQYGTFKSKKEVIKADINNYQDVATFNSDKPNSLSYDEMSKLDWLELNKGQAEIHMMELAEVMWDAYQESTPKHLQAGEWHIPFGDDISNQLLWNLKPNTAGDFNIDDFLIQSKIKIAVARCARVSYTVVGEEDKPANYENDIKLYDRLFTSGHMSPFEHVGRAMTNDEYYNSGHLIYSDETTLDSLCKPNGRLDIGWSGNFKGFIQHRKTIE